MSKCEKCNLELEFCLDMILNNHHLCPNCLAVYYDEYLHDGTNILSEPGRDVRHGFVQSRNVIERLINLDLTKKQYKELIAQFPNSFLLHDDFYDEDGTRIQPHTSYRRRKTNGV